MIEGLHKAYPSYRIIGEGTTVYYYALTDKEWRKSKFFRSGDLSLFDLKIPKEFL